MGFSSVSYLLDKLFEPLLHCFSVGGHVCFLWAWYIPVQGFKCYCDGQDSRTFVSYHDSFLCPKPEPHIAIEYPIEISNLAWPEQNLISSLKSIPPHVFSHYCKWQHHSPRCTNLETWKPFLLLIHWQVFPVLPQNTSLANLSFLLIRSPSHPNPHHQYLGHNHLLTSLFVSPLLPATFPSTSHTSRVFHLFLFTPNSPLSSLQHY